MAEVKWVKVATDMFESRKIKQIEAMPKGDTVIAIWLKMLLLAGQINDGGAIYITPENPYTEKGLAAELRRPLGIVKEALNIFKQFDMIEVVDGILYLTAWEKHQNVDKLNDIKEYNREAQRRSREKRKKSSNVNDNVIDNVIDKTLTCQPCHDTEEEEEEEKEIHSFVLSARRAREDVKRKFLGGDLGKGVVLLSDEQMDSLLNLLSMEEFDRYVGIVAEAELSGKHYTKKTHYQAILDMAEKDRRVRP